MLLLDNKYIYAMMAFMIAILLAYVLIEITQTEYASGAARYVVPERFRADVAALERQAADQAYVEHIVGLYNTWVSQVANLGHDTERVDKGLDNNRRAYIIVRERMERSFHGDDKR